MHEARVLFLKNFGYTELDFEGASVILSDVVINYKNEGFHGENLLIEVAVDDFTRVGFDLFYRITNKESSKEIAIGKTGIICFDYKIKKVISVPEKFKERFVVGQ
jgi:acyl-CoA thioesterase FadM